MLWNIYRKNVVKITKTICDSCKGEMDDCRLSILVGREADAAGDMDNVYFETDLCLKCLTQKIEKFAKNLERDLIQTLVKRLKG